MADILARPLLPAEPFRSLIANIIRIPAWASAHVNTNGMLSVLDAAIPSRSASETITQSVDRLDDALCRIVTDLIHGAENPAVLCSGGLDSAVIAAVVAKIMKVPPTLITVMGDVLSWAEMPLIESVVRALNARWITIHEGLEFRCDDVRVLNDQSAWPAGGVFSSAWRCATDRCVKEKIDLILTGEGANEICSPDGAEALDFADAREWVNSATALGRTRDTDEETIFHHVRRVWSNRFLPTRALNDASKPPAEWYGDWATHFETSRQRWVGRMDELHRSGFTWCEALARVRIDGLSAYAPADPLRRVRFGHPIADERFHAAYFSAPLHHRVGVRVGVGHKHLLRLVARRYLPAIVSEHRKIGPSNQVAVLASPANPEINGFDADAAEWLGLNLSRSFQRPWELPASAALDWTQIQALLGWAHNRVNG
jgi:hypothetical protein